MTLKLITAPAAEPLTLDEVKAHLRITHSDQDALLTSLIAPARETAEHELGRALITQTWERVLDAFPASEIELGMPPIGAIVSVKYLDAAGAQQTLSGSAYTLDNDRLPGWVLPAVGTSWPVTIDSVNTVRVRFTCGYGANGAPVPGAILQWMKLQIGAAYANAEAFVATGRQPAALPDRFVDRHIDRYRTYS